MDSANRTYSFHANIFLHMADDIHVDHVQFQSITGFELPPTLLDQIHWTFYIPPYNEEYKPFQDIPKEVWIQVEMIYTNYNASQEWILTDVKNLEQEM